jgi:hypothetical protein
MQRSVQDNKENKMTQEATSKVETLLDIIAVRTALAIEHKNPNIISFEKTVPNQALVVTVDVVATVYYNPSNNVITVSVERYLSLASRIAPYQVLVAFIVEELLNLPAVYPGADTKKHNWEKEHEEFLKEEEAKAKEREHYIAGSAHLTPVTHGEHPAKPVEKE